MIHPPDPSDSSDTHPSRSVRCLRAESTGPRPGFASRVQKPEPMTEATAARRPEIHVAMATIRYVKGDATQPLAKGNRIIAHVCNDLGGWGKGFVLAISKRWPGPEAAYRAWHKDRSKNDFGLGAIQIVQVERYHLGRQHGGPEGDEDRLERPADPV